MILQLNVCRKRCSNITHNNQLYAIKQASNVGGSLKVAVPIDGITFIGPTPHALVEDAFQGIDRDSGKVFLLTNKRLTSIK